ncbi:MAG: alpha/beta family hydrolase [Acidobacteriota bacterium]
MSGRDVEIPLGSGGRVSGLLRRPEDAWGLYVLAHGAGAGMHHPLMERHTETLAARGLATLRYQFPYMEEGRRRPDWPNKLTATVRSAVEAAGALCPDLPLFAGGRSMGGRMTSTAAAHEALPGVRGLAFLAFPLHPPKKPGTERAEHLADVEVPMLFLQGTRDKLARLDLLEPVCAKLDRAELVLIDGADHSFAVLKRSGRSDQEVQEEVADSLVAWGRALL